MDKRNPLEGYVKLRTPMQKALCLGVDTRLEYLSYSRPAKVLILRPWYSSILTMDEKLWKDCFSTPDDEIKKRTHLSCSFCKKFIKLDSKDVARSSNFIKHLNSQHTQQWEDFKKKRNPNIITKYFTLSENQKQKQSFLRWIICTQQPLSSLDHPDFRGMLGGLVSISSQTALQRIKQLYVHNKEVLLAKFINKQHFISITTDGWRSIAKKNYNALTGHYIDEEFNMFTMLLDIVRVKGSQTGEQIRNVVLGPFTSKCNVFSATTGMKLLSPGLISTDGAANEVAAIRDDPSIPIHIICRAHAINLVTKTKLDSCFPELMAKLTEVSSKFSHSVPINDVSILINYIIYVI